MHLTDLKPCHMRLVHDFLHCSEVSYSQHATSCFINRYALLCVTIPLLICVNKMFQEQGMHLLYCCDLCAA